MLVSCKKCEVSFADSLRACVGCGEPFAPTRAEAEVLAREAAVRLLECKIGKAEVRRRIADEFDLDSAEAENAFREAVKVVRNQAKAQGRALILPGFGCLVVAFLVEFVSDGHYWMPGFLAAGSAMIVLGAVKARTGWNLTGHDDD